MIVGLHRRSSNKAFNSSMGGAASSPQLLHGLKHGLQSSLLQSGVSQRVHVPKYGVLSYPNPKSMCIYIYIYICMYVSRVVEYEQEKSNSKQDDTPPGTRS